MNRNKLLIAALAALMCVSALVACTDKGNGTESGTETETGSSATVTRYNYLTQDVANYVTFAPGLYDSMTLTVPDQLKIEDEDVQTYIDYIRFENRVAINGTTEIKDIEVKHGDDAFIYYKGFLDGKAFEGGSNWDDEKPHQLGVGSQSFVPGFEEGLIGVVPNTTSKDKPYKLNVSFPEDHPNADLAGKAVVFHVAITHVVQYDVPAYTIDFITNTLKYEFKKDFYASDSVRFEEFEAAVREELEAGNKESMDGAKSDALWTYLVGKATFSWLPETEVEYYYTNYVAELQSYYDYYSASSINGEKFKEMYPTVDEFAVVYLGLEEGADWKADMKRRAEDIVKKTMLSHAIGEAEGLETISEEEFNAQVKYWVEQYKDYGMSEQDVISSMGEATLKELAFSEKIEKWLLSRVTFTYEDGTPVDGAPADTETETETEDESESEYESESDADTESESA